MGVSVCVCVEEEEMERKAIRWWCDVLLSLNTLKGRSRGAGPSLVLCAEWSSEQRLSSLLKSDLHL